MRWALLGSLPPVFLAGPASAQCLFFPGPGNDNFVCSSNSAPGLTDTGGNNTLTFPAGGTGVIGGNVTFGNGTDSVVQQSGRIVGAVNQGDGADSYAISGGIVNGTIQQGNGTDDFRMTGWIVPLTMPPLIA